MGIIGMIFESSSFVSKMRLQIEKNLVYHDNCGGREKKRRNPKTCFSVRVLNHHTTRVVSPLQRDTQKLVCTDSFLRNRKTPNCIVCVLRLGHGGSVPTQDCFRGPDLRLIPFFLNYRQVCCARHEYLKRLLKNCTNPRLMFAPQSNV